MKRYISMCAGLCFPLASWAVTLPAEPVLTTDYAHTIARAAHQNCGSKDVHASVSVVDRHGNLIVFLRGEGTGPHSVKTSYRKAYTAATLRVPTDMLALIIDQPKLSQLGKMTDDMLMLPGGLPIAYDDMIIGGIGMSGAPSPEFEEKCARDALDALSAPGAADNSK